MCLAVPGRVERIESGSSPLMGSVSFGGVVKNVCLDWVPGVSVGDYVIVHVGFAISTLDSQEAEETLRLIDNLEKAGESETGSPGADDPQ